MTAKTLYIVRHGQTEWNVARRMQGHRDSPLTALGETQAALHGRTLAREGGVERLYISPLGRTRATADLLNAHLSVAVQHEAVLMERDCGLWSGLTLDEIERDYPDEWQARMADPYHHRPPQGENLVDMETRVGAFVDNLLQRPEAVVALVTHGVMSRVLIKRLLALGTEEAATVRHPNELFYRVDVDVPGAASSAYFLQGQGPNPGLLRQNERETVPRR